MAAIFREMAAGAEEYLPPTHPAVQGFLQQHAGGQVATAEKPSMVQSDLDMIRVYEDLTDILLTKNVVMLTDFPPAAQDKLMRRKRLRSSLSPITELLDGADEEGHELP
ncbi:hypothetical protein [Dongia rigui]|uniref:Uncharacterized protein n=1 Tax=Dongia rigui TaxID=940149 RepID=A0ABU5E4B2_9PROT|nr:hypothetical protein [Dongia rigui]MDY0874172.1 hypothetical protein [Dongia rigui]